MLCIAAKLASESVDIVLAPDTGGLGGAASFESASTERASGADISLGSMFSTTSDMSVDSRVSRFWTRALRDASPKIPRSKAELKARWMAAHDCIANFVMLCKPMKASTVFARFSIHISRNFIISSGASFMRLLVCIDGRQSSEMINERWR